MKKKNAIHNGIVALMVVGRNTMKKSGEKKKKKRLGE
jgi:hypothetical protein